MKLVVYLKTEDNKATEMVFENVESYVDNRVLIIGERDSNLTTIIPLDNIYLLKQEH